MVVDSIQTIASDNLESVAGSVGQVRECAASQMCIRDRGEGAQAYGWGTYVTEVEGIGRTYAIQNTTTHNDALRACLLYTSRCV